MMMRVLTGDEMKRCDEYTIKIKGVPSQTLMERAAECTADEIISSGFDLSDVLVVCGGGNNGGDGFAAARFLLQSGKCGKVRTFFCSDGKSMTDGCALERRLSSECGIKEDGKFCVCGATLIVDAIFGIGLSRDVGGDYEKIINEINASGAKIAAVDIPSGISAASGAVMGCAVKADLTVTFAAAKRGQLLFPGRSFCGKLVCRDIGIGFEALTDEKEVFAPCGIPFTMPQRRPDSNKGTYGKVLVIGGAVCMAGAAYLSALAAYRTGAGLVRVFTPEENRVIIQTLIPEAVLITYPENDTEETVRKLKSAVSDSTAVVIGPGLSQSESAKFQLKTVFENIKCPLVIDADALNIIASDPSVMKPLKTPVIVTPHMGEMARLTGKTVDALKADPINSAPSYASEKGVICVMKDASTVVSDGEKTYINTSGTSAMSKGGAGDVLTGVIAALIATGKTAFEASCLGVFLHGKAGECAAEKFGKYSVLARDIADSVSDAIKASDAQASQ